MDTLNTGSSSSSSSSQGAAATFQAAPQNSAPPQKWEVTARLIALGIFQAEGNFSEFRRSDIAKNLLALPLAPEAFDGQLIGAIGRQLVLGIQNPLGLCRAAWAFQTLRIGDDGLKASLDAKALAILKTIDSGAYEETTGKVLENLKANYHLNDIEITQALCDLSRNRALFPDVEYVMNLLAIHLSPTLSVLSHELALEAIHVISKAYPLIPGIASVMCRLVQRWRQSGKVYWDPLTGYADSHRPVNNEIRSLIRWLALPEVMPQLSLQESVYLLSFFANHSGLADLTEPAKIMALRLEAATDEDIEKLSPEEAADALRIFLQLGLGDVSIIKASIRIKKRVKFEEYGSRSIYSQAGDPAIKEQFFYMILQLNRLPDTAEILELRDEFASMLVYTPDGYNPHELIKSFDDDEIQFIYNSYQNLTNPTKNIESTLQILKPIVEQNTSP